MRVCFAMEHQDRRTDRSKCRRINAVALHSEHVRPCLFVRNGIDRSDFGSHVFDIVAIHARHQPTNRSEAAVWIAFGLFDMFKTASIGRRKPDLKSRLELCSGLQRKCATTDQYKRAGGRRVSRRIR